MRFSSIYLSGGVFGSSSTCYPCDETNSNILAPRRLFLEMASGLRKDSYPGFELRIGGGIGFLRDMTLPFEENKILGESVKDFLQQGIPAQSSGGKLLGTMEAHSMVYMVHSDLVYLKFFSKGPLWVFGIGIGANFFDHVFLLKKDGSNDDTSSIKMFYNAAYLRLIFGGEFRVGKNIEIAVDVIGRRVLNHLLPKNILIEGSYIKDYYSSRGHRSSASQLRVNLENLEEKKKWDFYPQLRTIIRF